MFGCTYCFSLLPMLVVGSYRVRSGLYVLFLQLPTQCCMLRDELLEEPKKWFVLCGMGSTKVVMGKEIKGSWSGEGTNIWCFSFPHRSEFTSRLSQSSDKQILNIYDLCNKFIAYSAVFEDVVDVLAEWGSLYVLTRDGRVHALQEKDTQTKLEARPPSSQNWSKHADIV